ncbi:MAG: sulfur carrier protein ThiS adenylyltransferase ThiF [Acidaminococcaceae bacterium]
MNQHINVKEKIRNARIAIFGLGGIGSNAAVMLTRMGVGYLRLIDFDVVEERNLTRQSYYPPQLGQPKTKALTEQLLTINPNLTIDAHHIRVTADNALPLTDGVDIICEAFDQPEAKAMLVNSLLTARPETKIVCASGLAGYASSNLIKTSRKMKNFYVCGDETSEISSEKDLFAPRVQICAGHQANMILRIILGIEEV